MNTALLMTILNSAVAGRRKRSRRARRYLTGTGLLSRPAALLAGVGLAWGVYDTLKRLRGRDAQGNPAPAAPGSTPTASGGMAAAAASGPHAEAADSSPVGAEALRMIRLAVSAAHADGSMNERERAVIVQQAAEHGVTASALESLMTPRPLAEIVEGITSPEDAATLYVLAYTILRADEEVTGPEQIYLAQLAHLLRLDRDTIEALEHDTGARIDALGDQGQLGG